ncbi:serine/threonine protein kinase [Diaporthe eres]|nr:serine/threonine protein kinase [Diaporthe eres]
MSMIFGGDFNIFRPNTAGYGDEDYNVEVVQSQFRYFGVAPFSLVTEREVGKEDKEFILRIMKTDWRDQPTANMKELLEDGWFH